MPHAVGYRVVLWTIVFLSPVSEIYEQSSLIFDEKLNARGGAFTVLC